MRPGEAERGRERLGGALRGSSQAVLRVSRPLVGPEAHPRAGVGTVGFLKHP